jgi:predicted Zn-dependent protease
MVRPPALKIEHLEERTVPALFGVPWADAGHLTLSFVPNGTQVDGAPSALFGLIPGNTADWQNELLRAVETWAQYANINVSVVADNGQDLGAPGAAQGDPRFGDIRVSARPLSDNVLAITTPSGFLAGTRSGDIELNSTVAYSIGGGNGTVDLYSAMLQEVGHALGVSNSIDPASPMFENYSGVRTGLTVGDIATIQGLYGVRGKDVFEGFVGNDTLATARDISMFGDAYNAFTPVLPGDITTANDVDYYKVRTLSSNPNGLTFKLDASGSLLAPRLTVLNAAGTVMSTVQSTDPQTGTLTITLPTVQANTYYYVKVEAANPTFAVGSYELKVVFNPSAPELMQSADAPATLDDAHSNDSLDNATKLHASAGYSSNSHYDATATLRNAADTDFYKVRSPQTGINQQNVLTVTVRALNASTLAPVVQVYDKDKTPVAAQVLANENGNYVVQIIGAASNQDYYIRVDGQSSGTGDYQLSADFRSQAVNLQLFASATLSAASATDYTSLTANRSQLTRFVLSAGTAPAGVQAGMRMAIFDAAGHVVTVLFAHAGQTVTATTYLAMGQYTIRVEELTPGGVALPAMTYSLQGITLTDPIGPLPLDPTLNGADVDPDIVVSKLPLDPFIDKTIDFLGDVIW